MDYNENDRSAFIAIVGKPNVGKSSLLNAMLKRKVAIVSQKPQTTRTRVTGVLTSGDCQLVFTDTPGLLKPRNRLGQFMVRSVLESVSGVDACLLVVQAGEKTSPAALELIDTFKEKKMPAVLALNKIDLLADKSVLMAQISLLSGLYPFEAVVPVSAMKGSGVPDLVDELKKFALPGGHFFDDAAFTDQPDRFLASEMIREKFLRFLSAEVPHGVAVVVEQIDDRGNGITDVSATVYCEKESHKSILIGRDGEMIKKVGTLAREDMERFFQCKINLKLWVKVRKNWRDSEAAMRAFGYDNSAFDK